MLIENVDFTRDAMALQDVGWRAMAANVSDLAAMGAKPVLATIALGFPETTTLDEIVELYRGLAAYAARSKLVVVGGDLSRAGARSLGFTVVGEVRASNVKTRAGGHAGDVVAVTGKLGAARAGLELTRDPQRVDGELREEALQAFRRPAARVAEGRFLGASRNVTAMIDCSDGLSTDLSRLATASGCGAIVEWVPLARSARAVAEACGEDPERFGLAGGEDFELIVAIRSHAFRHVAARYAARFHHELLRVGALRAEPGVVWNGAPLEPSGWDHFR
jgi:thiamine-monophosphate kinase